MAVSRKVRSEISIPTADRNSERVDGYGIRKTPAAAFICMAKSEALQGAVVNSLLGELIGTAESQRKGA